MKMPRLPSSPEMGAVWYAVPLVWLCTAVVGWVLLSQWPGLFSEPLPAQSVAQSVVPDSHAAYESSDPSLPSPSRVLAGSPAEVSPPAETF